MDRALPVKTTQRALGTALGVIAASLSSPTSPPAWGLALAIGLLAGVEAAAAGVKLSAYSAVMTPLTPD